VFDSVDFVACSGIVFLRGAIFASYEFVFALTSGAEGAADATWYGRDARWGQ